MLVNGSMIPEFYNCKNEINKNNEDITYYSQFKNNNCYRDFTIVYKDNTFYFSIKDGLNSNDNPSHCTIISFDFKEEAAEFVNNFIEFLKNSPISKTFRYKNFEFTDSFDGFKIHDIENNITISNYYTNFENGKPKYIYFINFLNAALNKIIILNQMKRANRTINFIFNTENINYRIKYDDKGNPIKITIGSYILDKSNSNLKDISMETCINLENIKMSTVDSNSSIILKTKNDKIVTIINFIDPSNFTKFIKLITPLNNETDK